MIKKIRWLICVFGTTLLFTGVTARLAYVQIYCGDDYKARMDRQRSSRIQESIARGAILDREGKPLALDIQGGACYADPAQVENPAYCAKFLSPLLQIPEQKIAEQLREPRRFVWLSRKLDPETVQTIKAAKLPGIRVVREMERFYPDESLACHLLGVVSHEQEGLSGVERLTDSWLRGGKLPNALRQQEYVKEPDTWENPPQQMAHSIVLSIDRTLQYIVEQELARQMSMSRAKMGSVIVQDPNTGEILAMASAPTFNANWWGSTQQPSSYGPELLKNPAVERVMEPGSTFKIVTTAASFEEHLAKPSDKIFCENGKWKFFDRTINDHEKLGWTTLSEVMVHSSNIGMAKLSLKLGKENLYRYARSFGFGIPTGCGLPGDGAGILRHPKQWNGTSIGTIAFGQEVGVTPIQMVNAFSVIANGGSLREPQIYRGIIDEDGRYRQLKTREPIRQVVSQSTSAQLRQMLQQVVENGTGKAAQVDGITVAGKTGTAQKIDPVTRQYSDKHYMASFIGFAPADKPKVVIGVFLDDPETSYWGGSEAAPLFSRILRNARAHLGFSVTPATGKVAQNTKTAKRPAAL